jgi:hypothetical protein
MSCWDRESAKFSCCLMGGGAIAVIVKYSPKTNTFLYDIKPEMLKALLSNAFQQF